MCFTNHCRTCNLAFANNFPSIILERGEDNRRETATGNGSLLYLGRYRMDLANVLTLYEALAGDRPGFLFSGQFNDEHTARLITLGEEVLEREDAQRNLRGRLAFVVVEAYQNIIRHRARLPEEREQREGRCMFVLRSTGPGHEVIAINPILAAEEAKLIATMERIKGVDLKGLKDMFLDGLRNQQRTERGGAGLGLIEMTRRSGHSLMHRLQELDPAHRLFTLQALVGATDEDLMSADNVKEMHRIVGQENIILFCKGRMTPGMRASLLPLIEPGGGERVAATDLRKQAWLAAWEFLDVISTTGGAPLMMLSQNDEGYVIVVGAAMNSADADRITAEVEAMNALSPGDLRTLYRDALLGRGEGPEKPRAGLLELARRSATPLQVSRSATGDRFLLLVEVRI